MGDGGDNPRGRSGTCPGGSAGTTANAIGCASTMAGGAGTSQDMLGIFKANGGGGGGAGDAPQLLPELLWPRSPASEETTLGAWLFLNSSRESCWSDTTLWRISSGTSSAMRGLSWYALALIVSSAAFFRIQPATDRWQGHHRQIDLGHNGCLVAEHSFEEVWLLGLHLRWGG